MNAGVIGIPDKTLNEAESTVTRINDDPELHQCVEVQRTQTTRSGLTVQKGRAAVQRLDERESVEIIDGSIRVQSRSEPITKYTEFVLVPQHFIAVSNASGIFAFNLIGGDVRIERVSIDLDGYFDEVQSKYDASPWKAGFYGHLGNAQKGVIYGEGVLDDSDFGRAVSDSQKNQLGVSYEENNEIFKVNVTKSGYVDILQPSNYEEAEFADYVTEEILDHADAGLSG